MGWNRRILAVLGSLVLILLTAPAAADAASSHATQDSQVAASAATTAVKECGADTAAVLWGTGLACLGHGSHNNPGWPTLQNFANITPDRVWFHGKANDKGWSACFNPNSTWSLRNGSTRKVETPGSVQVTTNPRLCTSGFAPSGTKGRCGEFLDALTATYMDVTGEAYNSQNHCFPDAVGQTFTHPWAGAEWLIYNSGIRAWAHQNANGTGWADCFRAGIYKLGGTRDATPGNIQFTTVNAACP
jgi:hypothetical protein